MYERQHKCRIMFKSRPGIYVLYINLVVAVILIVVQGTNEINIYKCSSWKTVSGACTKCNSLCRLPVIQDENDYINIKEAMIQKGVTATWLRLKRTWLGEFLWLDCSKPGKRFLDQKWPPSGHCASLNLRDKHIEAGLCTVNDSKGAICEIRGDMTCGDLGYKSNCVKFGNSAYIKTSQRMNWETAKVACQKYNGHLAILPVPHSVSLINELSNKFLTEAMINYWIGLRREEWAYSNMDYVPLTLKAAHWDRGHPTLDGNCSIMIKSGPEYVWRSTSCSAKYNALCIKPGLHINPRKNESHNILPKQRNESSLIPGSMNSKPSNGLIIGFYPLMGILSMSGFGFCIYYIYQKKKTGLHIIPRKDESHNSLPKRENKSSSMTAQRCPETSSSPQSTSTDPLVATDVC